MSSGVIGRLIVNIIARTDQFSTGVKKARKDLSTLDHAAKGARNTMRVLGSALGAAGVALGAGAFIRSLKSTADEIDNLAKAADRLGVPIEKLQGLRLGAELENVDAEAVDKSIQRLTKSISAAAEGGATETKVLKELGLEARKLEKLNAIEQFEALAGAMEGVTNQGDKIRITMALLGREGARMLPVLAQGADGMRAMQKQAQELGIVIDRESAAKIENLNDQLTLLGKGWEGTKTQILIDITPAALNAVKALQEIQGGLRAGQGASTGVGKAFMDRNFPWTKALINGPLGRAYGAWNKRETDALVRASLPEMKGQSDFTARLNAKAAEWNRTHGARLGTTWAEFNRANFKTAQEMQKDKVFPETNTRLFRGMESKIKEGADAVKRGMTALGKGMNAAEKWGEEYGKSHRWDRFKSFWGMPGFRARLGAERARAAKEAAEKGKQPDVMRSPNRALEFGSLEAYVAARARTDTIPQKQLDEAKTQTTILQSIERGITKGDILHLIGL